jgi:hypothetical protein
VHNLSAISDNISDSNDKFKEYLHAVYIYKQSGISRLKRLLFEQLKSKFKILNV